MAESLLADSLESLGFPITLAFSESGGRAFLSERVGRLWRLEGLRYDLVHQFPTVPLLGHNENGLLGIALDPDFEKNPYIYCYYTAGKNDRDMKNRIVRIKEGSAKEEILLDAIPAGLIHSGGVMAFGPDKTLYIGVGVDDKLREFSQDRSFLGGKVLRINRNGSIPKDNPIKGSPVFSWGHRNIFGIAFHPKAGTGYICDVGPNKNDEINIVIKGGNYGWPKETGKSENLRTVNPIKVYKHVITPTQCVVVGNYLYFGSYNEGSVHRLALTGNKYDQVRRDLVVYKGDPFGVVGVFYNKKLKQMYVTTPQSVLNITSELRPKLEAK